MGLDFITVPDREGAACYILHQGLTTDVRRFEALGNDIAERSAHEVRLLDVKSRDGEKLRDFYDISPSSLPVVLIVRDDDTIHSMWSGAQIPGADVISHSLQHISQR